MNDLIKVIKKADSDSCSNKKKCQYNGDFSAATNDNFNEGGFLGSTLVESGSQSKWRQQIKILAGFFVFVFVQHLFTDEPIMSFLKKYKDIEGVVKIEEVNGEELVKKFAEEMEEMLGRKMKSVKVFMTHSKTLRVQKVQKELFCHSNRLNHTHFNPCNL